MSWTFLNSTSDLDKVRLMVGDTDSDDQLLTDESIDIALTSNSDTMKAAAYCARLIAAKFTRLVSKSIGGRSISYSNLASQYLNLAKELTDAASTEAAIISASSLFGTDGKPKQIRDSLDSNFPPSQRLSDILAEPFGTNDE